MKLRRLRLQGYKTFASKTDFQFDAGITAIVGPNGSGKSNIADAVRWVLGEQSYSTLRGKRTADMIFAGSNDRARAGMAQATITLDNSDGWLPIEYAEVEIGRRAYRSGENEYLINGQKVRLRDVHELLATSGLAERTYTIIGQGLIDQALSLRAEERRALFEEAAGVSHYQARRAETLRRLEETQRNLERVQDILGEIRPRLGGLKRQANRARNFEQVQADLRHMLRIWYGYQWEQRRQALREQRQLAQDAEAEWFEMRNQLKDLQAGNEEKRRRITQIRREIGSKASEREQMRERAERLQRRVAVLQERQSLIQQQLADLANEEPELDSARASAQTALSDAVAALQEAQSTLETHEEQLRRFKQASEQDRAEIDTWRKKQEKLTARSQELARRLAQSEGELAQLKERLAEQETKGNGKATIAEIQLELEGLQVAAHDAARQKALLDAQRVELQRDLDEKQDELKELRVEQSRLKGLESSTSSEVARLEAQWDLLERARDQLADDWESLSIGRLAQFVSIPDEHQRAIEAALGARLETLVLPDVDSLWQLVLDQEHGQALYAAALSELSENGLSLDLPQHPQVIGWAIDKIEVSGDIGPLARLLFGSILLVSDEKAAYELGRHLSPGMVAAAPQGLVVYPGGLVEHASVDIQDSVLAREEAWRVTMRDLEAKRAQHGSVLSDLAKAEDRLALLQDTIGRLSRDERQMAGAVATAAETLSSRQRRQERAEQRLEYLQAQQSAATLEHNRLAERIDHVTERMNANRAEHEQVDIALEDAWNRLAELPVEEVAEERQRRQREIATARTIVAGREAVVESRRATLNQVEGQLRRLRARREELLKQEEQTDLHEARQALAEVAAAAEAIDNQLAPLKAQVESLESDVEEAETNLTQVQRRAHDHETYYTQMQVAFSQRQNELEGLSERIRADLGLVALEFDEAQGGQTPLPLSEIVDRLPEVEELPPGIEKSVQEYRAQLHRIGTVNLEAPAEYEQVRERYEFLTQQVEDLNRTERRLRGVITELDELTSQAFAATVHEVDEVFGSVFSRLFGGGSARLVLTEPDDLTISGVDIVAVLPNRRQQRLALLSGGERSLTATALIFALLKVAPPPFCILDEVDAMLDEANVNRFREVLRDLSQNSQMIVITHNRGTVQAAETVYGISMGADSTSLVISLRPEEYVKTRS